ncbi:MAG TPA: HAD family hydrolase [Candidatus Acidoferrales bacterium]|nr:HAD family hydrolase [Candidatus Acidoferrales bacterium]
MIFACKAILFDLDGILVDSTPAVARVWARWAADHGIEPALAIAQAHGRRSIETIRAIAPQMNAEKENLAVEQMEIEDKEGVTAIPGAARLLNSLPQDRFAIVTSATTGLARARLGYAGLPLPRNLVTADDVTKGKPSPEPYLKGAALLRIAPRDCLVFEDAPAGIASAHAAGMQVIAIPTTYPAAELREANAIVSSLDDVQVQVLQNSLRLGF